MTQTEKLIKQYQAVRDYIIQEITKEEKQGNPLTVLKRKLTAIEKELARLIRKANKEARGIIEAEYNKHLAANAALIGVSLAALLSFSNKEESTASVTMPIKELVFDRQQQMTNAVQTVGRRIEDVFREVTNELILDMRTQKIHISQLNTVLAQKLLAVDKQGIGGITYKNGTIMPFDKYAAMVLRTATREAANKASLDAAIFSGSGLVRMSSHYPTCHICAPRQGRVYRIVDFEDGDERNAFPHISMAFPGWPEYPTVHPNCRHLVSAVSWDNISREEKDKMLADADKPFATDPRLEEEVKAYNNKQKALAERNRDYKQYLSYKAFLGDDMPSFSGWRRMKAANSEKYQIMQLDYKRRKALYDNPELKLPFANEAVIVNTKFTKYIFNPDNADGWAKGVAFNSRLGYNKSNWEQLKESIIKAANEYPATDGEFTKHGIKYSQSIVLYGLKDNPANVVVGWFYDGKTMHMSSAMIKEWR